jgi:hypothetical protein
VLLPDDAKVIDAAVFAARAVVVVRICAGAVVEEAGPRLRLHERVAVIRDNQYGENTT